MIEDEGQEIIERNIDFSYCDEIRAVPLKDWLGTDLLRLTELIETELQTRAARFDYAYDVCTGED